MAISLGHRGAPHREQQLGNTNRLYRCRLHGLDLRIFAAFKSYEQLKKDWHGFDRTQQLEGMCKGGVCAGDATGMSPAWGTLSTAETQWLPAGTRARLVKSSVSDLASAGGKPTWEFRSPSGMIPPAIQSIQAAAGRGASRAPEGRLTVG